MENCYMVETLKNHIKQLKISPSLPDWHIVEVEVWGPGDMAANRAFHTKTVRSNPANPGAVTGSATYASFLSSMLSECVCLFVLGKNN